MEIPQLTGGVIVIASIILLQVNQEQDNKSPSIIRAQRQKEN
jgi:hypothetical protein